MSACQAIVCSGSLSTDEDITLAYETLFDPSISTFIIRISGKTTEQDIIDCFEDYYNIVKENFDNQKFSVIINVDEEAHSSIAVLRLIRASLETQKHREYITDVLAVNENPMTVAARNANPNDPLPFFINEDEARQYLSAKIQKSQRS
jgi:hypothetical protein